ncbi:MAG: glycosyltransferase family 4 protein [Acidobacteriota bacterium]
MTRLGVFVGEKGKWGFFRHIFDDLNKHYETRVFREKAYNVPLLYGRLNRWAYRHGIRSTLRGSDLSFFEWASELLVPASHMPRYCPIVTRLHSYEINFWADQINWNQVDKVILVSRAMQYKFTQRFPEHAHKTTVVYNGVPLDKFRRRPLRDFRFNLGMLCRLHPIKRVYEMVLLVYKLKQRGLRPHLHVGGGRAESRYFDDYFLATRRAIEKLGLSADVTLHDEVEDTARWLRDIDIFVSNSYWEGQQVALLEAMAAGCYSLSHFWDGAEEILPPESIYITEDELLEKIVAYCEQREEERHQRQAQMETIAHEKFDAERQKAQIREIIEGICQAGV